MIEAARVSDGTNPCDEFLSGLEASKRKKDRERLANTLIVLEDFAHRRELCFPRETNNLVGGIKELKAGDVRLPFFDVEGTRVGAVRITHGFIKRTPRAPRKEINRAVWVREEDSKS
ncbi:hypothetical protein [Streptomyces sp. NPDC127119]|uniref:hypothetical protein n=1 Tax=Streptomyces sp. NPDC127119 TaxID=3345370 RepID=UPI00363CC9B0